MTDEQEFKKKYQGHWDLTDDYQRLQRAINSVRFGCVIRDDDYTKGFIDACKAIQATFEKIKKETL